jgi:hypothetical protein
MKTAHQSSEPVAPPDQGWAIILLWTRMQLLYIKVTVADRDLTEKLFNEVLLTKPAYKLPLLAEYWVGL